MKILRKFLAKANTPTKRIGTVLILLGLTTLIATAIHWQFSYGFIQDTYKENYITSVQTNIMGHKGEHPVYDYEKTGTKLTFGKYFHALTSKYDWYFYLSSSFIILGLVSYLGFAGAFLRWIKTGK